MNSKFVHQSLLGAASLLIGVSGVEQLAHADTVTESDVDNSKKDVATNQPYQETNTGSVTTVQNVGGASENVTGESVNKAANSRVPEGYQGVATNASYMLTNSYASQPGTELQDVSLGFLDNYHFGIQGSFTLDTADLKLNNKIYLGSITQSNSTGDTSHNVLLSNHDNMSYLSYMGNYIGNISFENIDDSRSDLFLTVKQENNFTTPTISITKWIDNDVWGYNWESDPKLYENVPDKFVQNIMLPNGKVYHVNLYNNISRLRSLSPRSIGVQGTHAFNIYDWLGLPIYKNGGRVIDVVDGDLLKRIDAGDKTAILPNTGYQAVYSYKAVANVGAPGEIEILPNVFVKNKENQLTDEGLNFVTSSLFFKNVGNDLSIADLKLKSTPGSAIYSLQDDGTYLCYVNLTPEQLTMDKGTLKKFLLEKSKVVAIDGEDALNNTLNYYFNYLGGRSLQQLFAMFTHADSNYESSVATNVVAIDPNTGRIITPTFDYHGKADVMELSGKSAVRIHYINGLNGQEIGNSEIKTGDPNSSFRYNAKNPLGNGYSLRNNTDNKLLNGTVVNGTVLNGSQPDEIIFPTQNSVENVYFIVDPNVQQIKINYIDRSDSNIVIKSDVVNGYSDNRVNYDPQAVLSALQKQGYCLVTSNLPNVLVFDHDDSALQEFTVTLTHLDSIERQYRIIEDLPNGKQKVLMAMNATLYKDASTNLYTEGGAYLNGVSTGRLLKANNVQIKFADSAFYTSGDDARVILDSVAGYTAQLFNPLTDYCNGVYIKQWSDAGLNKVYFDLFNGNSDHDFTLKNDGAAINVLPSQDFHVIYNRNQYPVVINYYDIYGNLISTNTEKHYYLDKVNANVIAPKDYVLLAGQNTNLTVGYDTNELDLLVAPKLVYSNETRAVIRVINVIRPDKSIFTVKQTVSFTRLKIVNLVDSSVNYASWQSVGSSYFTAYVAPQVSGYVSPIINSQLVTANDSDIMLTVNYKPIVLPTFPRYIDVMGETYDQLPDGYQVVTGQNPNGGAVLIIKRVIPVVKPIEFVTRTVIIAMPNGRFRVVKQKVRKGTAFCQVHLPKLHGYKVQIDGDIDKMAAESDISVAVRFVKC